MTLSELKGDYISCRNLADASRDRYLRTKDIFYCYFARTAKTRARRIKKSIRKIEKRILIGRQ